MYERYVFNCRDQETNETVDAYVTALRKLARKHPFAKKKCPAWGTSCKNCRKPNHFAVCCQASKKKVLSVECESDEEYEYVAEIKVKEKVHALESSGHHPICHWTGGQVPAGQWIDGKHHER